MCGRQRREEAWRSESREGRDELGSEESDRQAASRVSRSSADEVRGVEESVEMGVSVHCGMGGSINRSI